MKFFKKRAWLVGLIAVGVVAALGSWAYSMGKFKSEAATVASGGIVKGYVQRNSTSRCNLSQVKVFAINLSSPTDVRQATLSTGTTTSREFTIGGLPVGPTWEIKASQACGLNGVMGNCLSNTTTVKFSYSGQTVSGKYLSLVEKNGTVTLAAKQVFKMTGTSCPYGFTKFLSNNINYCKGPLGNFYAFTVTNANGSGITYQGGPNFSMGSQPQGNLTYDATHANCTMRNHNGFVYGCKAQTLEVLFDCNGKTQ